MLILIFIENYLSDYRYWFFIFVAKLFFYIDKHLAER